MLQIAPQCIQKNYQNIQMTATKSLFGLFFIAKGFGDFFRNILLINNKQITKIKTVNLILRIVAVQMEHLRRILHQIIAHQAILHQVIVHQEILHLPIRPSKKKLHLPQIAGSYKISHIYKMIL